MKTRFNFACITSLICLSVLAFTSRLSAGMIASPAANASYSNTSGHTSVTVNVNAPAGTEFLDYYINDYQVTGEGTNGYSNADDYFEGYNQEHFEFKFLQGGSYTVKVDARNSAGTVIESDSVTFSVDYYSLPDRYNFRRMNGGEPIIDRQTFIEVGATREGSYTDDDGTNEREYSNLNGPHVIRVPDWVPNRPHDSAQYYCYFAGHRGQAICMAWAADIAGPWNLYNMDEGIPNDQKGVLAMDNGGRFEADDQIINLDNGLRVDDHMASPEILIDDANRRIIMYFHSKWQYQNGTRWVDGTLANQVTFVVTSADGLTFDREDIVGCMQEESYLSVFWYENWLYGMGSTGQVMRHPDPLNNLFSPAPGDWTRDQYQTTFYWQNAGARAIQHDDGADGSPRHIKVLLEGDTLFAAYSADQAVPEELFYVEVDLKQDRKDTWDTWKQERVDVGADKVKVIHFLARAEAGWEGGQFEVVKSETGRRNGGVNQLRDPQFFKDHDGKMYMVYAGQGEDAIGMARLVWGTEEVGNNAPQILSPATATRLEINVGETTRLSVVARDEDGDPLTYTWRESSGTVTFSVNGTGSSDTVDASFSSGGTYKLEVTVRDSNGAVERSSVDVTVLGGGDGGGGGGGGITVSFDSPTNNAELPNGQAVIVTVNAGPVGDISKVRLKVNGVWQIDDTTSPYVWDLGVLGSGNYPLLARVVPSVGDAVVETINIKVLGAGENSSPTITRLTASPMTLTLPKATTELTAIANDSDEGDTLTYSWSGAGVTFASAGAATTTATLPSVAGTYNIQLEVTDGNGGRAIRSVDITITGGDGPIDGGGDGDGGVRDDSEDDGCGCSAAPGSNSTMLLVLIVLGLVFYRKRLSLRNS